MTNRILLSAVAAAALTIGSNVAFAGSSSSGHGSYDSNKTSGSSATMGSQSGTTGNQSGATSGSMGGSSATTGSSGNGAMLNSQQRESLKSALSDQDVKSVDSSKVQARVGSKVPSSVELHKLPSKATANVPAMKGDRFVKLDNGTILIVSSDSRTVVDVIQG